MLHKKFINARNVGEQAKQLVPQSMLSIFRGPQNKIERVIKKGGERGESGSHRVSQISRHS